MNEVKSARNKAGLNEWRAVAIIFQMFVTFVLLVLASECLFTERLVLNKAMGFFLLIVAGIAFGSGLIICYLPVANFQGKEKV